MKDYSGHECRLIDVATGEPINLGDTRQTSDGKTVTVSSCEPPHKPSSAGKVWVTFDDTGATRLFYAGVIGAAYERIL